MASAVSVRLVDLPLGTASLPLPADSAALVRQPDGAWAIMYVGDHLSTVKDRERMFFAIEDVLAPLGLTTTYRAPLTAYDAAQCRAIADGDAALMRRYGAAPPPDPALPDPGDWVQRALRDCSVPSGTGNDWLRALREQDAVLQKAITDHDLLH